MSQVSLIPKQKEECGFCNGKEVSKIYLIGEEEISGIISPYSVAPLRILTYVMAKKGMNFKTEIHANDPWQITKILLEEKDVDYVKVALQEIMEYRCSYELGNQYKEIIRQLPFEAAMRTSQNILDFNKVSEEHDKSLRKHLIYKSVHGGYNIKTKGYSDSNF